MILLYTFTALFILFAPLYPIRATQYFVFNPACIIQPCPNAINNNSKFLIVPGLVRYTFLYIVLTCSTDNLIIVEPLLPPRENLILPALAYSTCHLQISTLTLCDIYMLHLNAMFLLFYSY